MIFRKALLAILLLSVPSALMADDVHIRCGKGKKATVIHKKEGKTDTYTVVCK